MNGYVQGIMNLAEQSSSPATPDTGFGKVYFKADGNLYIKDDTGTETQITGVSGSSSGGVDEHVYPLSDFNLTNAIKTVTAYTGAQNYSVIEMGNLSSSTIKSPLWRASQSIIDNITAGKNLFVEVDVSAATTGSTDIIARLTHWDDSAGSYSVTSLTKTATISATEKVHLLEYEFSAITPAFLDRFAIELYRGTAGTLGNALAVSEVRILSKTGAGS